MNDYSSIKDYFDATVTAAEVRQVNPDFDYPPDAYALAISIRTDVGEDGKVFLEVSSRPGRSESTKDKKQYELALNSIRKIKPDATYQDLCDPRALVDMPCRVLRTTNSTGKTKWFLVFREDAGQAQPAFDPAAMLRSAMATAGQGQAGAGLPPPPPPPMSAATKAVPAMRPILRSSGSAF